MGYPTSDEAVAPDGVGHYVNFEDGSSIYWYPVVGAWRVPKEVMKVFSWFGAEAGRFGYPVAAPGQTTVPESGTGISQEFQKGAIIYVDKGANFDFFTASY